MKALHSLAFAAAVLVSASPVAAQAPAAPPRRFADRRFTMTDGEGIYKNVCQACHMANAMGAKGAGAYPALADNMKLAASAYAIHVVMHGQKGMPAFGLYLDDLQVAAVVSYVRTHFGNTYAAPVTSAEVGDQRERPKGPNDVHGGLPSGPG